MAQCLHDPLILTQLVAAYFIYSRKSKCNNLKLHLQQ